MKPAGEKTFGETDRSDAIGGNLKIETNATDVIFEKGD